MKECPFCFEEIQDRAIKCKHCGEMLNSASEVTQPAPVVQAVGAPTVVPEKATDTESTVTVDEIPQASFPPNAAQVPQQAPAVQPVGGSPAVLEPVQVTGKGELGKNTGDSPSSLQIEPTPKAVAGCVACIGLLVVSFFLLMSGLSGSPSRQNTSQANQSGSYK